VSETRDKSRTEQAELFLMIYRSRSRIAPDQSDAELGKILRAARSKNRALGVTGALMLYDGWFAQALEGPRPNVEGLLELIRRDPRHDAVTLKSMDRAPERVFGQWNMALVGEHGHSDIPMLATRTGIAEGEAWKTNPEQEKVLAVLRDLTRGYGIGA